MNADSHNFLDYEIFRLKDEIEISEGPGTTFYDFLGVSSSATQDEISKASRKKSRLIHPDKAKQAFIAQHNTQKKKPVLGDKTKPRVYSNKPPSAAEIQKAVKTAGERYARLGVITEVLKGSGRERYDHFLSHGFPAWRGTGYYYARFRPGLGTVLVGLFVVGGGAAHYGAMYISWKRQRSFVERYIRNARKQAWGDDSGVRGIPGLDGAVLGTGAPSTPPTPAQENGQAVLNRRQRRMQAMDEKKGRKKDQKGWQGKDNSGTSTPVEDDQQQQQSETTKAGPAGTRRKVQGENGKVLIVDSLGDVYLEGENEDGVKGEYLLDPESVPEPRFQDTVLYRFPVYLYELGREKAFGKKLSGQRLGEAAKWSDGEDDFELIDEDSEEEQQEKVDRRKPSAKLAEARKKGGGKRSKAN